MGDHELKSVDLANVVEGQDASRFRVQKSAEHDSNELRNFGFMSMLSFSCTVLGTWEGVLALLVIGFLNGGPAGLVYGSTFTWVGTLSVFITLSELVSLAPTSGGQYHWVSILAPRSYQRLLSYVTGWLTVTGWQAAVASASYLSGTMIQGLLILNYPAYVFQPWHGTLLLWACLAVAIFINTVVSSLLPKIESDMLVLHILGFFGIIVPLVYMAPHASASDVFATFLNEGGWNTQGLSFFVGLSGSVYSFLGADSAIHMCEEIKNASIVVPRSIITSLAINGVLGFGMLLAVLFCLGDPETVLGSNYIYPYIQIFVQATNSNGGTTAMASIIIALAFCTTVGNLASSSRMTWSFARDRGLPGWRYLSKVGERTSIPLIAIAVTATIACLLSLINIGSATAFNDVISLTINGFYASYLIPSGLLLWRRSTGYIRRPYDAADVPSNTSHEGACLTWGPWRIPGAIGIANNVFACAFMVIVLFFSFWPSTTPTSAPSMNFSVLVTGFVTLWSMLYYLVWGRKSYTGPVMEIDVANKGSDAMVVTAP